MSAYESDGTGGHGRRHSILAGVFLILAGVAVYLPPDAQEAVASSLRGSVLYPFVATQRSLADTRLRMARVEELQAQLDSVIAAAASHRTLAHENEQLRALLSLRETATTEFVPATVIRPGTRGSESTLLLDVGSEDGVEMNQPVVSAQGLVGIIREVRERSSLAMDWTHPDFRVSAMSADGKVFGIVEPWHGSFREEDRLVLSGTPFHAELPDSTLVVTSGRGSVYPRGIAIGRVHSVAEAEAGWRKSYWLLPAVRPAGVTHVLVMTGEDADPSADVTPLWAQGPEDSGASAGERGSAENALPGGGAGAGAREGSDAAERGSPEAGEGEPGGGG